jgi:hypothetical protein
MRIRSWPVLLTASALVAGCAFSGVAASRRSPSAPVSAKASIVGRWQTLRTCRGLVKALKEADLEPLAPGVVGDYFPNKTPEQLARKRHLCKGATPQRHAHFFTSDGGFGSLDQHNQQVDDGSYRVTDAHKLRIGDARFRFHIHRTADGEALAMKPVITRRTRRQALAHPLEFSTAGYAVAVSYPGHTWRRVPCGPWC